MIKKPSTRFFAITVLFGSAMVLNACGGNVVLDDYRQGAKNDCASQPTTRDYQACIEAVDRSYEDYQNDKNN